MGGESWKDFFKEKVRETERERPTVFFGEKKKGKSRGRQASCKNKKERETRGGKTFEKQT